nr:protein argonaute 2-like [Ipomoea batatas]
MRRGGSGGSDQYRRGDDGGRGGGRNGPRGGGSVYNQPPVRQAWTGGSGGNDRNQQSHGGGRNAPAWGGSFNNSPAQPQSNRQTKARIEANMQSLRITEQQIRSSPSPSPSETTAKQLKPVNRPDRGTIAVKPIKLLANHFRVRYNPRTTIMHYDVDIKQLGPDGQPLKKLIPKPELYLIRDQLCEDYPDIFPIDKIVYDGERNIFSAIQLPTGKFKVVLSDGENSKTRIYMFSIKLVRDYLMRSLLQAPRNMLQGLDLVMKDNPSRHRISIGRSFYSTEYRASDDLRCGAAAYRGFKQSLKLTSQGPALSVDYSVMAFHKPQPVFEFLNEHIPNFSIDRFDTFKQQVIDAIGGLKVNVTHRITKQKFTIFRLTDDKTRDLSFELRDPLGKSPPRTVSVVDYFWDRYGVEIKHKDIPCLDLGKNNMSNFVPIEFCVLVEGQRFLRENLDFEAGRLLKRISQPLPEQRRDAIHEIMQAEGGPCGAVTQSFGIGIEKSMTHLMGRILPAPDLKLGASERVLVNDKGQWDLAENSLVEGRPVLRWALIDFTAFEYRHRLKERYFVSNLKQRCKELRIHLEDPLIHRRTNMQELSNAKKVEDLLKNVVDDANKKTLGKLQVIVCVMGLKHYGYKYLKWVSETKIGVVTQCCLSKNANEARHQYLGHLCMKLNAKLGGSNVELMERLPHFEGEDHVMFIGADVNHPSAHNSTGPSMAAVVATVNWPAANRYAARVCPQEHRKEKILSFGSMCAELVNTYARLNYVKPKKIVIFRDGVGESQLSMVLNEELDDFKKAICDAKYQPTVTLVVAQKRHPTRMFLQNRRDGGGSSNVPPGTVVDTVVVHPSEFDFYLYSHYGSIGTSKPTHYYVIHDENRFTSDDLQRLIYNLCFTSARCTKSVSLIPPVFYADLVAYRGRLFQEVISKTECSLSDLRL